MRRRVVISGMGSLSSAGRDLESSRKNFADGNCCLSEIDHAQVAHLRARYAGLLKDFDPVRLGVPARLLPFHKHVAMAFVAARETLASAQVKPEEWGSRLAFIFATCSGPMLLIEKHYERIIRGEPAITSAELYAKRYYAGAQVLAEVLGIRGLTTTVVTACTAGTGAVALAADLIRCGMLDAALAGGADAFSLSTLAGFDGLKATSEGKCAPFSKPVGLNLGEAASFVFLEAQESARARRVRVHGEVAGSGMSNDAYHCSSPEPTGRGLALAIQRALRDAGIEPSRISYINAHGTGTEANDKAETRALRKALGDQAEKLPVSSTKSVVGHCLGAAGTIEVVASIACAEAGVVPPTANFNGAREGCNLDYVPETGRSWVPPRTFLSNNLAFGGHNASLVLTFPAETAESSLAGDGSPIPEASLRVQTPARAQADDAICVTGFGLVTSVGLGAHKLKEAERSGVSGLRRLSLHGFQHLSAGMVEEDGLEKFDRRLDLRHMDRASRCATVAAQMALREAGFSAKPADLAQLGLFLHLAAGPSWAESEFLTSFLSHDHRVEQLLSFPYIVPCSVAGNVCRSLRLTGHNLTLSCGPGAGLLGLGPAIAAFRSGQVDALLTGAVDELSDRILADSLAAGLLADEQTPPGEGAAVLLLETVRHARTRNARPLAFIRGCAFSGGAETGSSALDETVNTALTEAGITPLQVSTVCADAHDPRVRQAVTLLCPAWADRLVDISRHTGHLEASQPLVDLAAAFQQQTDPGVGERFILSLSESPHASAAVVFEVAPDGLARG